MEYMLIIHTDETIQAPGYGEPGFDEFMGSWLAFNQELIDGGHWVSGANLLPTSTATTIHLGPDGATVVDGPYAETKEQFGGYYVISAQDLDEAIDLVKRMPLPTGSIEVRPVAFRPDAAPADAAPADAAPADAAPADAAAADTVSADTAPADASPQHADAEPVR